MFFDTHNHSQFSFDGEHTTVEKSARAAIDLGFGGICFSDHTDFFIPPDNERQGEGVTEVFDVPAQQAEIDRVNSVIREGKVEKGGVLDGMTRSGWQSARKFKILKGVEIGLQNSCRERIRRYFAENTFDQVIASVHYLDGTDPYWGGYYQGKNWKEAYGHYLDVLYREMKWLDKDFDIMGHFDYITRYAPYPKSSIFYKDFPSEIDEILRFLIQEGKGLEINTRTYRKYGIRTPVLDNDILLRYRELGGEIITLGSDSHRSEEVGGKFMYYAQFVKMFGFRYLAHFEDRKLKQVTI